MADYTISIKNSALRHLSSLPLDLRSRIVTRIEGLAKDPRPVGVKKLVGVGDAYRLRVGDHRVVYEIHDDQLIILVVRIGHRREVYR